MLKFKVKDRVPFPGAIQHLLRQMSSESKAKQALPAFKKFVENVVAHLATTEGQAKFLEKTTKELRDFPEEEYSLMYVDGLVEKEMTKLNNLLARIKANNPTQQFQGQVDADAMATREFQTEFQGKSIPKVPHAVEKYLVDAEKLAVAKESAKFSQAAMSGEEVSGLEKQN